MSPPPSLRLAEACFLFCIVMNKNTRQLSLKICLTMQKNCQTRGEKMKNSALRYLLAHCAKLEKTTDEHKNSIYFSLRCTLLYFSPG